jgi:phosphoenolpyruvate-protein phosphotransferase (PTS system enzyme I)
LTKSSADVSGSFTAVDSVRMRATDVPIVLRGSSASPGVAVARALVIAVQRSAYVQRRIEPGEEPVELARLSEAVQLAMRDLRDVAERAARGALREERAILEAYLMMLDDPMLRERVERHISREKMCAEWAVAAAGRELAVLFDAATEGGDPYLRERRHDVDFVCDRLLRALAGEDGAAQHDLREPTIVVAKDLSPADTAAMGKTQVLAIVTERGSPTSHTAIMARALQIPAIVGIRESGLAQIQTGDWLVVDGYHGTVTVHPSPALRAEATARAARQSAFSAALRNQPIRATRTSCGTRVQLFANVELESEVAQAIELGADGIGLYRTEFLYIDRRDLPTEEEQLEVYKRVLEQAGPRPVTLRTFDLGGDKFASALLLPKEMNPALGLRAIRLALAQPDVMLTQLRAMLRASAHGNLRIMVPMITSMTELRLARALLLKAVGECQAAGIKLREPLPSFGMMVEVPAAATLAGVFAREADFFSIGTNDLVQYALAVDRTNERLTHLASALHPAVLHLIASTLAGAASRGIPVALCGALAQDPLAAVLLVGLGLRELSMGPSAIPLVRAALARVSINEAMRVAERALMADTAETVDALLREQLQPRMRDLLLGE